MYKEITGYLLIGIISSFFITKYMTAWLIPKLKSIKMGQKILDIGPRWHKNKEGTPTMGGLAFLLTFVVSFTALAVFAATREQLTNIPKVIFCGVFILLNGAIGLIDDYTKFFKKQNQGLSAGTKFLLQFIVAAAFTAAMAWVNKFSTMLYIPFWGKEIDLGWGWYVLSVFLITGIVNSVNLTDGIDGLASTVTLLVSGFFLLAGAVAFDYGAVILASVIIGITFGFLVYNLYPARIFMGDTGSLFLGAAVVSLAYMLDNPLIILVAGFIYVLEAASDIIQVAVYKLTKKRVFKMAPIHHHFEKCGWSEMKIVGIFSLITVLCCVAAYFGL